jgi:hypothetical protein
MVGHSRAPAAAGVRTRPTIEREFHISWWCIFTTRDHTQL